MKYETRVMAFDDAHFDKTDTECLVVGIFYRGGYFMDGVISTTIQVDGDDATLKIKECVSSSRFQPRILMFKGVAMAGFNVIDFPKLAAELAIPIIVVTRENPASFTLVQSLEKKGLVQQAAIVSCFPKPIPYARVWYQPFGIRPENAENLLKLTIKHSDIPEPLRVAHLVAQGVTLGESKGRA